MDTQVIGNQRFTPPHNHKLRLVFHTIIFQLSNQNWKFDFLKLISSKSIQFFSIRDRNVNPSIRILFVLFMILGFKNYTHAQWDSCYLYAYSADSSVLPLDTNNFNFHGTSNPQVDSIFTHYGVIRYFQTNPKSKLDSIPHKYKVFHSVHSDSIINALQYTGLYYKFEKIYVPDLKLLSCTPTTVNDGWKDANVTLSDWYIKETNLECAWNITTGNSNVKIAIIDQDYDEDHLEFQNNLYHKWGQITNSDHGTKIAGIISAKANNNIGVAGFCHGCQTTVYDIGLTDQEEAILHAINAGNRVLNLSWSAVLRSDKEIQDDIEKGIIYVQGHGNGPYEIENRSNLRHSGYILVAGSKINKEFNDAHNWGPDVDICAPSGGLDVLVAQGVNQNNQIICMAQNANGTSYATPMVVGTIGLMLSVNPDLNPYQIECILKQTAQPFNSSTYDNTKPYYGLTGAGILDAYEAVKLAQERSVTGILNITGYYAINGNQDLNDNIVVSSTGELEIIGANINFSNGKGIRVEAGGKLRILNSTLTSLNCENWEGITIEGSNGTMSGYQSIGRNHAWIDMLSSTIERAKVGIQTGVSYSPQAGGVFTIANSVFRDCRFGIKHNGFIDPVNPGWNPSFVRETSFICANPIPMYFGQGVNTHIWLYDVKGITISACLFNNQINQNNLNLGNVGRGRGIGAWDAGFIVKKVTGSSPCFSTGIPNVFEGLEIGVHSGYGSTGPNNNVDWKRTTKVMDSEFINNRVGGLFLNDNATVLYRNNYIWDNNLPDLFSFYPASDPVVGNSFSFSNGGRRTDNSFNFNNTNHLGYENFAAFVHQNDGSKYLISGSGFNLIQIDAEECKNFINSTNSDIKSIADYLLNDITGMGISNGGRFVMACNTYKNNLFRAWVADPTVNLIEQIYQESYMGSPPPKRYYVDNIWEPCLKSTNPFLENISIQNNLGTAFEKIDPNSPPNLISNVAHNHLTNPINPACYDLINTNMGVGSTNFDNQAEPGQNPHCLSNLFYSEATVYCPGPDGLPGTPDDEEEEENGGVGQGEYMHSNDLDSFLSTLGFGIEDLLNENKVIYAILQNLMNQQPPSYIGKMAQHALIHFYGLNTYPLHNLQLLQSNNQSPFNLSKSSISKKSISVFPNPTTGLLNILSDDGEMILNVWVLDITGKRYFEILNLNRSDYQIDFTNYNTGIYYLKVENTLGQFMYKFIKQ